MKLVPSGDRTDAQVGSECQLVVVPGMRVFHREYGEGVITESERNGYAQVFFASGERSVDVATLRSFRSRNDRVLATVAGGEKRQEAASLVVEAHELSYAVNATELLAAPIDLLPHQIVLTHRIASSVPRRVLIADEVGLGKTIEVALLLRELASKEELCRALIVVPAGLVNNWHRELNEVFHLGFEVFGSDGDVSDRLTNAFEKHDKLIASIDTLKRPVRVKLLLRAPRWDIVVFDEAHHLNAYKSGKTTKKTENYKLAEAMRRHTRDLLLLSATPHQGDHYRFFKLVQLLDGTLFDNVDDMVKHRYKLNLVMYRRTKADACRPDGSPLFARRWVHTESFTMNDQEQDWYGALREYLKDGFDLAERLAKQPGNKGRGLGLVMTVFQKIAASSFAAIRQTLRKRLIMLTIHEAINENDKLNIGARKRLNDEAKELIAVHYNIESSVVGESQVDVIFAELRSKMLKKLDEAALERMADSCSSESVGGDDVGEMSVDVAIPEERARIKELLRVFPGGRETKVDKLLNALGTLWLQDATEKTVVFATYLGTVDLLGSAIDKAYPDKGVVVLRGGDHGAKRTAERRFKQPNGPCVLVCTAAGREGINLQFAKVLFNFDLPWNPMDIEQRIGRIHRYGQKQTAQVYNLVLSDTIEGSIFLLLEDKLKEIALALGKVDENGNTAEDLRCQVLGQLSERLTYEKLYREALRDPELKRTKEELKAALSNAAEARKVVFQLFQDLEGFSLEDYRPASDITLKMRRVLDFIEKSVELEGGQLLRNEDGTYTCKDARNNCVGTFTLDREVAKTGDGVGLLGMDCPLVAETINRWKNQKPECLGVAVKARGPTGVLSWWNVRTGGEASRRYATMVCIGVDADGNRSTRLERIGVEVFGWEGVESDKTYSERREILANRLLPMLDREVRRQGLMGECGSYSVELVGWVELVSSRPSIA